MRFLAIAIFATLLVGCGDNDRNTKTDIPIDDNQSIEVDEKRLTQDDAKRFVPVEKREFISDKFGKISVQILSCDDSEYSRSSLILYRYSDSLLLLERPRYRIDRGIKEIVLHSDDSGCFLSQNIPVGLYNIAVYPSFRYPEREPDTSRVANIRQKICDDVVVPEVRIGLDSTTIIKIQLPGYRGELLPDHDPIYFMWKGEIIPNE